LRLQIAERDTQLEARGEAIREREEANREREARIVELEAEIREREKANREREARIVELEAEIRTLDETTAARASPPRAQGRRIVPLAAGELLVEAQWGGFVVVPAFNIDVAIGVARDGVIEPWTTRLVQDLLRPGDIYFNAGANYGYYVCLAGRIVGAEGRVVGIEPNPHVFPYLLKSIYWNGTVGNTELVSRALSDEPDQSVSFEFDPQYLGGGTMLAPSHPVSHLTGDGNTLDSALWSARTLPRLLDADGRWIQGIGLMLPFAARTITIDNLVAKFDLPRVDLLHLDIEGSEPLALVGAKRLIETSPRLRMITEWSAGHYAKGTPRLRAAFDEVWAQTQRLGWRVRHLNPRLAPDGGVNFSPPLSHEQMTNSVPHGDYLWTPVALDTPA
jgi:FkbM family methyltransferase